MNNILHVATCRTMQWFVALTSRPDTGSILFIVVVLSYRDLQHLTEHSLNIKLSSIDSSAHLPILPSIKNLKTIHLFIYRDFPSKLTNRQKWLKNIGSLLQTSFLPNGLFPHLHIYSCSPLIYLSTIAHIQLMFHLGRFHLPPPPPSHLLVGVYGRTITSNERFVVDPFVACHSLIIRELSPEAQFPRNTHTQIDLPNVKGRRRAIALPLICLGLVEALLHTPCSTKAVWLYVSAYNSQSLLIRGNRNLSHGND